MPVPLEGLIKEEPLDFPLYLKTGDHRWVLYRDVMSAMGEDHIGRLRSEGVECLYIRVADRRGYYKRVEGKLDEVLRDPVTSVDARAQVLYGVATEMAEEILSHPPDKAEIKRATRLINSAAQMVLREDGAFRAVRQILKASNNLSAHCLTVSMLSMGLARHVIGSDPNTLAKAGLAGFLHDIGRVDHEADRGPEHAVRGYERLRALGLDKEICEVALYHHERADGSGFPRGLGCENIPPLAAVVSLVNTFDSIYSGHKPRVGIFDSLCILAQAYRGCFDKEMTKSFVELFKD